MTREYIVSLEADIDYDQFWTEMETTTFNHPFIPNRCVDIVNARPASTRSCHYALTDQEAVLLMSDPRVIGVDIPAEHRTDISLGLCVQQSTNFTKTTTGIGAYTNWGLLRSSFSSNIYGTGTSDNGNLYNYHLDGTGVDIVTIDTGVQVSHPEFFNGAGVSRIQQIDWFAATGGMVTGTMPVNHYRDLAGHGTHVMGIAGGLHYGWAKNANLYNVKMLGLDSGDPTTGLFTLDCFEVIKWWHINKPVDPATGAKRPTVVNMSFAWSASASTIYSGNYRGTSWASTDTLYNSDTKRLNALGIHVTSSQPTRYTPADVCIAELTASGIIVCIAGANDSYKHDTISGADYNNVMYTDNGAIYYHQGTSPYDSSAIKVGSIDSSVHDATREKVASYSKKGPAINIWAPGSNIVSSTSIGGYAYSFSSGSFKQTIMSGTSMATPQITGMSALYMQANPGATPAEVKDFLIKNSKSTIYSTGLDTDYANGNSLQGADNNMAYLPFADDIRVAANVNTTATLK